MPFLQAYGALRLRATSSRRTVRRKKRFLKIPSSRTRTWDAFGSTRNGPFPSDVSSFLPLRLTAPRFPSERTCRPCRSDRRRNEWRPKVPVQSAIRRSSEDCPRKAAVEDSSGQLQGIARDAWDRSRKGRSWQSVPPSWFSRTILRLRQVPRLLPPTHRRAAHRRFWICSLSCRESYHAGMVNVNGVVEVGGFPL